MKEKKLVANRLVITFRKGENIDETTIIRSSNGYVVVKEPDWLFFNQDQLMTYLCALVNDFDCQREMEITCL